MRPFRYDNIETHMRTQHPFKWAQYKALKKVWNYSSRYEECNQFFANVTATPRSHFRSPVQAAGGPARPPLVFTINKDIVEVLIAEMMYSSADEIADSQSNGADDGTEVEIDDSASMFRSAVERDALISDRNAHAARSKAIALSLFDKIDGSNPAASNSGGDAGDEDEDGDYSTPGDGSIIVAGNNDGNCPHAYVATISKPLLFELAVRYISCGTSFRMAESIMRHTSDVFGTTQALNRNKVSQMMRVACAANLQKIYSTYMDVRFRCMTDIPVKLCVK